MGGEGIDETMVLDYNSNNVIYACAKTSRALRNI